MPPPPQPPCVVGPLVEGLSVFAVCSRWQAVIVDGHSVEELCKVLNQPRHQPLAIIAKTIKGKGIPGEQTKRTPTRNPPQRPGLDVGPVCRTRSRFPPYARRLRVLLHNFDRRRPAHPKEGPFPNPQ